jgi:hypothetical protein
MPATMAIRLYIKHSGTLIGEISELQLQCLVDLLEEEDDQDQDYYVDADTLEMLGEEGADEALLALLRPHVAQTSGDDLDDDEGIEIEWKKD